MLLIPHLLSQVYDFLQGRITRVELEDWIVPRLHILFADLDSPEADLAAAVELGLAEMSDGLIDEEEFRNELHDVIRPYLRPMYFHSSVLSTFSQAEPPQVPYTVSTTAQGNTRQYVSV
jgi:hypothetical protein